jgi:hypothetical protein
MPAAASSANPQNVITACVKLCVTVVLLVGKRTSWGSGRPARTDPENRVGRRLFTPALRSSVPRGRPSHGGKSGFTNRSLSWANQAFAESTGRA